MRRNPWIVFFVVVLAADIMGILLSNQLIQLITKPLIIPALGGYFFSSTRATAHPLKKCIFLALFFSWAGDLFLLFVGKDSLFFLLGLSSFLIAHIFYIIFFHGVRVIEAIKSRIIPLLIVAVYYTTLIFFLSPYLHDMKLPVRIYGVVISFMFMLAMHMLFLKNRKIGLLMMLGALLFVISDSALAIDKFYQSFEGVGVIIMVTYGLAQLLITEGAIRYIKSSSRDFKKL